MSEVVSPSPASTSSRGSYPSRQKRFGPAPLASFEDLPTDEQSSSEDEKPASGGMACPQISFLITSHNEPPPQLEESVSECRDEANWLTSTPVKEVRRKGSWTDIFSLRKSPTPTKARKFSLFNFKFFSRDSGNGSECALEQLGSSASLARAGSALSTSSEKERSEREHTISHASLAQSIEQVSASSDLTPTNVDSRSFSASCSINETVIVIEQTQHTPNLIEDDGPTIVESRSQSASSCSTNSGQGDWCCDTESDCQECKECSRLDRASVTCACGNDTDCCNVADNEDNDEETEPNLVSDEGELECLLTNDELLEASSHLNVQPLFKPIQVNTGPLDAKVVVDRLKTSPIDRPHSITPINVNSFEAYIKQFTPDEVDNGERLTIKLPGLESHHRNRFTRKSNPYIWQEFCEKGLKSPQSMRKRANSCFPQINQNNCQAENLDSLEAVYSAENLTPITPIKDLEGEHDKFDDNFWDYLNRTKSVESGEECIKMALSNLRTLQTSCSCECNSSQTEFSRQTSTTAYNATSFTCSEVSSCSESENNETSGPLSSTDRCKSDFTEDQPLVSPCDCMCHRAHPLNQFSLAELSSSVGTNVRGSVGMYDSRNTEDEDFSQLSSSTLSSSSSSTASSTSQSVRLLDTTPSPNV